VQDSIGQSEAVPGRDLWQGVTRRASAVSGHVNTIFLVGLTAVILAGWRQSGERHLTPEEGIGYILGIVGSAMMLLLLVYPLRKRLRWMRAVGSVRIWFHIHMLFGIIGPSLILFHANFSLGSANSTIAFLTMTTVMLSGLVGRFLYIRIHKGFSGQKAVARELLNEAAPLRTGFTELLSQAPEIEAQLAAIGHDIMSMPTGLIRSLRQSGRIVRRSRMIERALLNLTRDNLNESNRNRSDRRRRMAAVRRSIARYFGEIRKAATLAVCDRLFALWHVLHLPLFVMMVLTAIMHVIAVHLY